ncbi:MAG TPA: class I SAM-dependent methyltransferase [bacterium]|nr:class I SAM-dependent methyltransferase [bacterium]
MEEDFKEFYDERYKKGLRKSLSGYEFARWHALYHFFKNIVKLDRPERILDYGCGSGLFYPLMRSLYPDSQIYGADISSVALDVLTDSFPEFSGKTNLIKNDKTDYQDNFFDLIISIEVMEHVEYLDKYLTEINRILKKDGVFIWTTPCANRFSIEHIYSSLTDQIGISSLGFRRWKWEDEAHVRRLTSQEAEAEMERLGFNDFKFRFRAHFFSFVCTRMSARVKSLSRLFDKMMNLDYILFRKFPNGASMIGAAKKK